MCLGRMCTVLLADMFCMSVNSTWSNELFKANVD